MKKAPKTPKQPNETSAHAGGRSINESLAILKKKHGIDVKFADQRAKGKKPAK